MTTKDGSKTAGLAEGMAERRAAGRIRLNAEQSKAVEFLRSRTGTTAKVLVGAPGSGKTTVLKKVCAGLQDYTVLRASGGRGATTSLLASLLHAAGLHPEQLSRGEQESLLTVFLEHERTKGKRVLIAVDGAEKLSADEWSELGSVHTLQLEGRAALELIIVGRPDINKHIRSPVEGWRCARTRFHTLASVEEEPETKEDQEPAQLIVTQDGDVLERVPLKTRTLIGRNIHNDVCVKHPTVSRHHAVIVETPTGYYVVDLNSKNGLSVNGNTVTSAALRHSDVMTLGVYRIKVMAWGKAAQGDPRPAAPSLSRTATIRVKELRRSLERSLRDVKTSAS